MIIERKINSHVEQLHVPDDDFRDRYSVPNVTGKIK